MQILGALRYYWVTAAGYRLRPWRSPYILWRLETYFGKAGHVKTAREFFRLIWKERAQMNAFLEWVEERRTARRDAGF